MAVKASAQITITYVVDVKAVYRYYLLQSSTASTPSKPTTFPPSSSWDDTEPTYTEGSTNSLYFVDCTVLADDSFTYSEVSLSSSYEAAKVSYNKAVNAQNTANSAQEDIDNLEIGTRNLAVATSDNWEEITVSAWSGSLVHIANEVESYIHNVSDYGASIGDWLSFGVDLTATGKPLAIRVDYRLEDDSNGVANVGNYIPVGETGRSTLTIEVKEEYPILKIYVGSDGTVTDSTVEQYKCLKIEKGNKATDWTPAPEDMATNEDVSNNNTEMYEVIAQQQEDILTNTETHIAEALKSYVETGDYSEFKQTVEGQLSVLTDEISMKFTEATTLINEVDGDLQLKYNEITTYFDFGVDGLVIGKSDSPYKTVQTNERYSMQVNSVEVLWIDLVTKSAHIPVLTITEKFTILGYLIDMDGSLNVNCEYIGGE